MAQVNIPKKTRIIMAVCALFMPIFLILPFIFWGSPNKQIPINFKEVQMARLKPVGHLVVGTAKPAAAAAPVAFEPQKVYDKVCSACHANGTLGAPKFGNKEEWAKHLANHGGDVNALAESGIKGIGAMPPKGGSTITNEQFHQMVGFMLSKAGIKP